MSERSSTTNLLLGAIAVLVLGILVVLVTRGEPDRPAAPPLAGGGGTANGKDMKEAARRLVDMTEQFRSRRTKANESAAIATLRQLTAAQAHFQAAGLADEDFDGVGGYGTFAEMAGAVPVRGTEHPINPPVLSAVFRRGGEDGAVRRSGYRFHLFLPGPAGKPSQEGPFDPNLAEAIWFCVALPEEPGVSGMRLFLVTQAGDVLGTDVTANEPPPENATRYDERAGAYVPNPEAGDWMPVN
jgi:hypothetical protein